MKSTKTQEPQQTASTHAGLAAVMATHNAGNDVPNTSTAAASQAAMDASLHKTNAVEGKTAPESHDDLNAVAAQSPSAAEDKTAAGAIAACTPRLDKFAALCGVSNRHKLQAHVQAVFEYQQVRKILHASRPHFCKEENLAMTVSAQFQHCCAIHGANKQLWHLTHMELHLSPEHHGHPEFCQCWHLIQTCAHEHTFAC